MVVHRQLYLRRIDADGTQPFEEVRAKVLARAEAFFHLVAEWCWCQTQLEDVLKQQSTA